IRFHSLTSKTWFSRPDQSRRGIAVIENHGVKSKPTLSVGILCVELVSSNGLAESPIESD
ncbi:MAG: hypothetical protein PVI62_13760, partial [Desulfobacterales bacterium]